MKPNKEALQKEAKTKEEILKNVNPNIDCWLDYSALLLAMEEYAYQFPQAEKGQGEGRRTLSDLTDEEKLKGSEILGMTLGKSKPDDELIYDFNDALSSDYIWNELFEYLQSINITILKPLPATTEAVEKQELIEGNLYVIDASFQNGGIVMLMSKGELFGKVMDVETRGEWETMLHRLSEIPNWAVKYATLSTASFVDEKKEVKSLQSVMDLDGKLNTYVHAHGSETYVELQQLWFKAINEIQNLLTTSPTINEGREKYIDRELAKKEGWIDVNIEFPEFDGMFTKRVLAFDGEVMKVCSLFKGSGTDKVTGYGTTGDCFMRSVTHWRYLPTPPTK